MTIKAYYILDSGCPDAGIPAPLYVLTGPFEFDDQTNDGQFRMDVMNVFMSHGIIQGSGNLLSDHEVELLNALK